MAIRKHRIYKDLPVVTPITTTKILVTDETTGLMGFASVSALQTTVDGAGLATDTGLAAVFASASAYSASIASNFLAKFPANTVTGSVTDAWNDTSASVVGVAVGGLYHSQGAVRVRLS